MFCDGDAKGVIALMEATIPKAHRDTSTMNYCRKLIRQCRKALEE